MLQNLQKKLPIQREKAVFATFDRFPSRKVVPHQGEFTSKIEQKLTLRPKVKVWAL